MVISHTIYYRCPGLSVSHVDSYTIFWNKKVIYWSLTAISTVIRYGWSILKLPYINLWYKNKNQKKKKNLWKYIILIITILYHLFKKTILIIYIYMYSNNYGSDIKMLL